MLEEAGRPLGPAEIHRLAQSQVPRIGLTTIYRALKVLVEGVARFRRTDMAWVDDAAFNRIRSTCAGEFPADLVARDSCEESRMAAVASRSPVP